MFQLLKSILGLFYTRDSNVAVALTNVNESREAPLKWHSIRCRCLVMMYLNSEKEKHCVEYYFPIYLKKVGKNLKDLFLF